MLSTSAFTFTLRRYTTVDGLLGRAVQVDSSKPGVESAYYGVCNQRGKLEYHKLLSTFASNFNLLRYSLVTWTASACAWGTCTAWWQGLMDSARRVIRCHLTQETRV